MMLTYAAQMRGLLADYDTPTGLIWEMWDQILRLCAPQNHYGLVKAT